MKSSILHKILQHLKANPKKSNIDYFVPNLWLDSSNKPNTVKTNFNSFYCKTLESIFKLKDKNIDYNKSLSKILNSKNGIGGDWTYTSTIYNIFPRLSTAYDHDNDGNIGINPKDITMSLNGILRETGTFLKVITILPYIKSLGCNVLYFLPITKIGSDGNKGDLGAPYAIKNQYKFDENLAEPLIPFSVEDQFKALVEAAHILGIRVVLEFVLRTSSLDGDWVKENPEWFYWIDRKRENEYSSPEFTQEELNVIKEIPKGGGFHIAPNEKFRSLFKNPPKPNQIKIENGKYIAYTDQGELIIPGAFADWPPDDIQPAWSDVTYLRMYNFPLEKENNYNYIAYNTIRYYSPELAQDQNINRQLWDKLAGVIPYYQKEFGIDGVMMDMGHAVPKKLMQEIIHKAREIDPDFAFMEENFEIEWDSRNAGYNGTLGFEWRTTGNSQGGIKNVMHKACSNLALPFFGTPETHNTPRAMQRGGIIHSKQMYIFNATLPNCIPFIHSGYELLEDYPINTGLNFTEQEINHFKNLPLGLFFKGSYNWNKNENLIEFIKFINIFRNRNFEILANGNELGTYINYPDNNNVISFERFDPWKPNKSVLVIANTNYNNNEKFYLKIQGTYSNVYKDYISNIDYTFIDNWISADLKPGQCILLELNKYF